MSEIIGAINRLAALLAQDAVTIDQVGVLLGKVARNNSGNVIIAPHDPLFTEANIVRRLGQTPEPSSSPAHVDLTLAQPQPVASFESAFGTPREIPSEDKGVPPKLIFHLEMEGQPQSITLIASLKKGEIVAVTLRWDRRL